MNKLILFSCFMFFFIMHALFAEIDVDVAVDIDKKIPVNNLIFGQNIEWINNGDGIYSGGRFNKSLLQKVKSLYIPLMRFPGGTFSDYFIWEKSIGGLKERERIEYLPGKYQFPYFGVDEFISLCKQFGAEPVFTVNVDNMTCESLRNLCSYFEENGVPLKRLEFGNEPYLYRENEDRKDDYPACFAEKTRGLIDAVKKYDSSVLCGVPLYHEPLSALPVPFGSWNDIILKNIGENVDFVALHNTYYPALQKDDDVASDYLFYNMMGALEEVSASLENVKKILLEYFPQKRIPIAVTEYNSFTAFPGNSASKYIADYRSSVYVASLIEIFLKDGDILFANYWSLLGNWYFGLLDENGRERPSYKLFLLMREYLGDYFALSDVEGNVSFKTEPIGIINYSHSVRAFGIIPTFDDKFVYLIMINRWNKELTVNLNVDFSEVKRDYFPESLYENGKSGVGCKKVVLKPYSIMFLKYKR